MAKIGWLADYFHPPFLGGAEIHDAAWIKTGERRGHKIVRIAMSDTEYPADLDLVIAVNTHFITQKTLSWLMKQRYVNKNCDIRGESHYPMRFKNAVHNFFMSPLHELLFKERYEMAATSIIPPIVDEPDTYKSAAEKKHYAVHMSSNIAMHKGFANMVRYAHENPDLPIRLYGRLEVAMAGAPKNMTYMGIVNDRKEVRRILSEAEYYILLVNEPGCGSMACLEALLSGCKFITNEYEGLWGLPFPWRSVEAVRRQIKATPRLFWTKIEEIIGEGDKYISEVNKNREQYVASLAKLAQLPNIPV